MSLGKLMQTSHVISEVFVIVPCLWVLYQVGKHHGYPLLFLWGLFFASVCLAAFTGALRFAEVHPSMEPATQAFQKIASTFGSCGLLAGVCWLFKRYAPLPLIAALAGALCYLTGMFLENRSYYSTLQMLAMLAVLSIALFYCIKPQQPNHRTIAGRLILAIVLSALATTSLRALPNPYAIDVFHYLLGAAILSFGWAAMAHPSRHSENQ